MVPFLIYVRFEYLLSVWLLLSLSTLYHRYLYPLIFGDYPEIMKKNVGSRFPVFTSLESETIKGSFDFIGVNYYNTMHVKDKSSSLNLDIRDFFADTGIELICMFFLTCSL